MKPRRVSAVFWPDVSLEKLSPAPLLAPPSPLLQPQDLLPTQPVLIQDWPRCQIRLSWLNVVRSETVVVAMGAPPPPEPMTETTERLIRNARPSTTSPLTLTLHGLPATFAHAYGFALLEAA